MRYADCLAIKCQFCGKQWRLLGNINAKFFSRWYRKSDISGIDIAKPVQSLTCTDCQIWQGDLGDEPLGEFLQKIINI